MDNKIRNYRVGFVTGHDYSEEDFEAKRIFECCECYSYEPTEQQRITIVAKHKHDCLTCKACEIFNKCPESYTITDRQEIKLEDLEDTRHEDFIKNKEDVECTNDP